MVKLKRLIYPSVRFLKQQQQGFAMSTLMSILVIVGGLQIWQLSIFKNQMSTYANIAQNYRLDIVTNEIKIELLDNPDKKKFKSNGVVVEIYKDNIIYKLNDKTIIKRKFIAS